MRGFKETACAALAIMALSVASCAYDACEGACEDSDDGIAFEIAEPRDVGDMMQMPHYPTGCEVVSLVNAAYAFGVRMSFDDAFALFEKSDYDFVNSWWGDPYGGGGAAYPPAMVDAARKALDGRGVDVDDRTECGLQGIADIVQSGGVAIAWTTTDMEPPEWTGWVVDGYEMYSNEHCVVVYGIRDGEVLCSDPLRGMTSTPIADWYAVWDACGQMAVSIG